MKKLLFLLSVVALVLFLAACNNNPPANTDKTDEQEQEQENTNNETEEDEESTEEENEEQSNENNEKSNENEANKNEEDEESEESQSETSNEDDLASAFEAYVDEIILLAPEETRILDIYSSVTGENYENDQILYDALVYDIIPSYSEFVGALEGIISNSEDIHNLHQLYIEAATIQLGAFTVMVTALEEQDSELIDLANEGLAESRNLISQWQTEVQNLSAETGVSLQ